jgi:hypothetical protein
MPADKLILLSFTITKKYLKLAEEKGERKWGYAKVLDLRTTDSKLPVILYCGGFRNGIHKIVFVDVAHLGLSKVQEIASDIFGDTRQVSISRVDWCVDVDAPLLDLALYCRIARAQNCKVEHSGSGPSFYLRCSKACTIYMYDKHRQLKAKRHPIARKYELIGPLTRIEIQFKGNGLPFKKFVDIKRYADIDLLADLSFWKAGRKRDGMTPMESLAAEGLLRKIDEDGLQMALKMFSAQERAYVVKNFLQPARQSKLLDLSELMRKSARDWLENRIRFPRLPERRRR